MRFTVKHLLSVTCLTAVYFAGFVTGYSYGNDVGGKYGIDLLRWWQSFETSRSIEELDY